MDDMKTIMILGASILQLPAIQKAKEMGLRVIAVDMDKDAVGMKYADVPLVISTIDIPAVVAAAKEYKINGIITLASDLPILTVAVVAKECGLVGVDEQTALNATNKAVMRHCLKEHGVPIPIFHKVSNREEYASVVAEFQRNGMKFIVKPADNSGSRGVFLVDKPNDNQAVAEAYSHSKRFSHSGDIVVEEYMEGPEVSVETLSIDGECHVIQITDKLTTGAPFFVEMGHSQPTQLEPVVAEDIQRVAKMSVEAIGIKNGPSHTEIKATPSGAKIVELGARLGGDCITTHLVPLSTGVDMVECCIKIALGETPYIEKKFDKGSAIRYFETGIGEIKSIEGIEEAEAIEGVKQASVVHGVGDRAKPIESSTNRVGFVIAQSDNARAAVDVCYKALENIRIEIRS